MTGGFAYREYRYTPSADQAAKTPVRHPVVIIGAGPVGLAAALDLAVHGRPVVVLEAENQVSAGSRAICWSKRTLEIMDRLGVGQALVEKGVTWRHGKVFFGDRRIFEFDLLPDDDHKRPAFINLQQYHFEQIAIEAAERTNSIDLRWRNRVIGVETAADGVRLTIETSDGPYRLEADYLLACDGARSPTRKLLGLDFAGRVFEDRFLIADVVMKAEFPTERWFWFDSPFNRGQSALLHRQADDVWRVDLQLGRDADPAREAEPDRVLPRLRAMLGDDADFELDWVSVYTFQCRRLERFRHGRILFAGDSAHQVSPFGARGGNSGIQDADNLVWKLALVLDGKAPESLLDSYDTERIAAADENILCSTRSTDFISPKSGVSRAFRDAVLDLAERHDFARRLVNSGRLSLPARYDASPLVTPDAAEFADGPSPGSAALDARVEAGESGWLLDKLGGCFCALYFADGAGPRTAPGGAGALAGDGVPLRVLAVGGANGANGLERLGDPAGHLAARYDAAPGTVYLFRPDQHVAARWRTFDVGACRDAVRRAIGSA